MRRSRMMVMVLAVAVLLGGCMKPMIEQTIQGDELLTVHSDANFWSPSFTLPVRSKCVRQEGVTTVVDIDGNSHTCYGVYVEVQHLPVGYQDGMGSALGDGVVTAGSAALIMHGLRGMGDKDSNNTTNSNDNDTASNGGNQSQGQLQSQGQAQSQLQKSSTRSSASGGSVINKGRHR